MAKTKTTDYDRARKYLDEVAEIAAERKRLMRMKEYDDMDWEGTSLAERVKADEEALNDAKNRMSMVGGDEGDALICRYVLLLTEGRFTRSLNCSRTTAYRKLERGVKALVPYLPDDC